jgi:hypothetical protein
MATNELSDFNLTETSPTVTTLAADLHIKGSLRVPGDVTVTTDLMIAGDLEVDGTLIGDLPNHVCVAGVIEDLVTGSGLVDVYVVAPVTGYLLRIWAVLQDSIAATAVTISPTIAGVAKAAANITILASSPEGTIAASAADLDETTGEVDVGEECHATSTYAGVATKRAVIVFEFVMGS